MGNLTPSNNFSDVYQLTSTDLVDATNPDPMHPNGIANRQAKQLLDRTFWLYKNTPANKAIITVTTFPPSNIDSVLEPGHYTLNSSTASNRGGLIVFVNGEGDHSRIQLIYRNLDGGASDVRIRCWYSGAWSAWLRIGDAQTLMGYDVSSSTPSNGQILRWNGSQWAPATNAPSWSNITGKPSTFRPRSHSLGSHNNVSTFGASSGDVLGFNGSSWVPSAMSGGVIGGLVFSYNWYRGIIWVSGDVNFGNSALTHLDPSFTLSGVHWDIGQHERSYPVIGDVLQLYGSSTNRILTFAWGHPRP